MAKATVMAILGPLDRPRLSGGNGQGKLDLSRLETLRRADPLKESGFLLKEVNSLLHPYGAISKVENLEKEVQDRYYLPISVIVEFEMCDARRDALGDCRVRNVRRSR
ncbi:hypothetical protein BGZ61DRAFT_590299 [Ilyonectria robusta]|uniref:uncharacterized protein n=1 Tax=Ilyonectria robusta TaxID=1079257 RepID=UPI001E8D4547|nr:uncharacterized protein BGZ61DRAFT_590299 [Ilyonectria robusta]KAH8683472.1 hypothetical protein BGZ61DRAFT_590299 [Ilyonectria robusta]